MKTTAAMLAALFLAFALAWGESAPQVAKVSVRLSKKKVKIAAKVRLSAACFDSKGKRLSGVKVEWITRAGPVDAKGVLTAKRTGSFDVIARAGGKEGKAVLEVEGTDDPPKKRLKFLFIHHSCGANLLRDGLREALRKNNYLVNDASYGTEIAQKTDPPDFVRTFGELFEKVMTWRLPKGERYDIVAFKSCYPACNIRDERMLESYKSYYRTIMKRFRQNPNVLFIPFSPPPLVPAATRPERAKLARKFANWLKDEYSYQAWNVWAFDFFGVLADPETDCTRAEYRRNERDSHPNSAGNRAAVKAFIPFINTAVRAVGLSD